MDCQGALAAAIIVAGAFYIVNGKLGVKYTQLPITAKQIRSKIKRLRKETLWGGYSSMDYIFADVEATPVSTSAYVVKSAIVQIVAHMQKIIDMEAPISYDILIRRALRSFDILRASVHTTEDSEKTLKKVRCKSNKQNGIKYFWREDQDPEAYNMYREDVNFEDKRSLDDVTQHEFKMLYVKHFRIMAQCQRMI